MKPTNEIILSEDIIEFIKSVSEHNKVRIEQTIELSVIGFDIWGKALVGFKEIIQAYLVENKQPSEEIKAILDLLNLTASEINDVYDQMIKRDKNENN